MHIRPLGRKGVSFVGSMTLLGSLRAHRLLLLLVCLTLQLALGEEGTTKLLAAEQESSGGAGYVNAASLHRQLGSRQTLEGRTQPAALSTNVDVTPSKAAAHRWQGHLNHILGGGLGMMDDDALDDLLADPADRELIREVRDWTPASQVNLTTLEESITGPTAQDAFRLRST